MEKGWAENISSNNRQGVLKFTWILTPHAFVSSFSRGTSIKKEQRSVSKTRSARNNAERNKSGMTGIRNHLLKIGGFRSKNWPRIAKRADSRIKRAKVLAK